MSTLTSTTYAYTFDDLVLVRVASENNYGISAYTYNLDGAHIRSVPSQMNTPVIQAYSDTFINVTWAALTDPSTGNSPITSYSLYWNAGSGTTPSTLVTDSLITAYQFTAITGGSTYYFAVIANNIYGAGTVSSSVSVTAIDIPGKMSIPTVSNSGLQVVVTFT